MLPCEPYNSSRFLLLLSGILKKVSTVAVAPFSNRASTAPLSSVAYLCTVRLLTQLTALTGPKNISNKSRQCPARSSNAPPPESLGICRHAPAIGGYQQDN